MSQRVKWFPPQLASCLLYLIYILFARWGMLMFEFFVGAGVLGERDPHEEGQA